MLKSAENYIGKEPGGSSGMKNVTPEIINSLQALTDILNLF
jgi:hypothetical protein